jgi:hypothetical protein
VLDRRRHHVLYATISFYTKKTSVGTHETDVDQTHLPSDARLKDCVVVKWDDTLVGIEPSKKKEIITVSVRTKATVSFSTSSFPWMMTCDGTKTRDVGYGCVQCFNMIPHTGHFPRFRLVVHLLFVIIIITHTETSSTNTTISATHWKNYPYNNHVPNK